MALTAGTRLGSYEITEAIGAGGMGEVYRARDTALNRDVAIKVLPEGMVADPDRLARFKREAEALAALNHPNIAHIHGLETSGATPAIVMELVEGPTLADRIAGGPLSFADASPIARQIAEALEAAHERGIVHRDLKPANIKVKEDGTVKVLDFGLAKAVEPDASSADAANSPTLTARATQMGTIIGTAAYMAPEQARGKPVDRRADIWAFGVVLYEMLTGQRAFVGETVSDILAAIIKEPPDLDALPPLPGRVRTLLDRLLQKDPKLRLRDIGDARLELEAARHEPVHAPALGATGLSGRTAIVAGAAVLAAGLGVGWLARGAPEPPPERRVILATDSIASSLDALAVSPDGSLVAEADPATGIRVRAVGDLGWRLLPDTAGVLAVSFDAAGARIYFSRGPEVLSVGVDGSSPLVEASLEEGSQLLSLYRGLDGVLQATQFLPPSTTIMRLPPGGGAEELWSGQPAANVNGAVVVTSQLAPSRWLGWLANPSGGLGVVVIDEGTTEVAPLLPGYRWPVHLGGGDVLAVDDRGRLTALTMAPASGEITTQPAVRVEGLALVAGLFPAFDVASDGSLVYVSGRVGEAGEVLTWIDRAGVLSPATARAGSHDVDSRLAGDGRSLALEVAATETSPITVWIHDLERDVRSALTPGIRATFPVWSPDSREVALRLGDGIDPQGIYVVPADRSAPPRLLLAEEDGTFLLPMDWSPDGETLLYVRAPSLQRAQAAENGLWTIPAAGGDPEPFLETRASEVDGRYSPDGRWIAYRSDQSGQDEIYLRPVAGGGEIRVSADGGSDPEWNPAGGELFFLRGRQLLSVAVDGTEVSAERELLELPANARPRFLMPSRDGQRFVLSMFGSTEGASTVNAIFNWRRESNR